MKKNLSFNPTNKEYNDFRIIMNHKKLNISDTMRLIVLPFIEDYKVSNPELFVQPTPTPIPVRPHLDEDTLAKLFDILSEYVKK